MPTSWRDYREEIRGVARSLIALGFEPGEKIGILGFNRPEWVESVLGAMSAGGAAAGIYTTNAPEQVAFVLGDCGARIAVVENAVQLAKVLQERGNLPALAHVVVMDDSSVAAGEGVLGWSDFIDRGREVPASAVDARVRAIQSGQLATLIYTSGTTGEPKGVMLSHGNVFDTVRMIVEPFGLEPTDSGLSYLPLAHIAEQIMTVHMPAYLGCAIYYAEAPEKILDNLKEVRPTILFGVPRVWERFYAGIQAKLQEASGLRRALAEWTIEGGRRAAARAFEGKPKGPLLGLRHRVADRLVASKVRRLIGFDRIRLCASGAAPIAREVLELFSGLGIPIYEVYGLSESTGPLTWNQPGRTRLGTVGPPLGTIEVAVADDGEVVARGPNVFMGYLNRPEDTAEALAEGWLHTGDLGVFDDDGYLTITGRKKNLIITSGGKNVAPEGLETALKQIELVAEAVVLGDRQRFVSALLSLDADAAARFAADHGLDGETELHRHPRVVEELRSGVDEVNRRFSRVESIREFRVLPRNLSMDEDELTPTLKVKRQVVEQHFAELIEDIYAERR